MGTSPDGLFGQVSEVSVGGGFFIDFPSPLHERYCEGSVLSGEVTASRAVFPWLSIEASGSASGAMGSMMCATPALAPIPQDTEILEYGYAVERGPSIFTLRGLAVIEPFAGWQPSPRLRVGVGGIVNKSLPLWTWGLGVRYRFGSHAVIVDLDRWRIGIEEWQERVIYPSTGARRRVLARDTVPRLFQPVVVRFAWSFELGQEGRRGEHDGAVGPAGQVPKER